MNASGIIIGNHGCSLEQFVQLFAKEIKIGHKKIKTVEKMVKYAKLWQNEMKEPMVVTINDEWDSDSKTLTFETEDDLYENIECNTLRLKTNTKIVFTKSICQSYIGFNQGYKQDVHISKTDMDDLFRAAEMLGITPTFSIVYNCCS